MTARRHWPGPRRSVLYVPGSNARALEKARALPCDAVILDLEDSVAPDAKAGARGSIAAAIAGFSCEVLIRINDLSSPHAREDFAMAAAARPHGVMLPKVMGPGDIAEARAACGDIPVWALIETPMAVLRVDAVAAAGVEGLVMGTNDLAKELRITALPDRRNLWHALSATVTAARAHGATVLDGTFNALEDGEGLAEACTQGRAFGFDGKTLIHPSQIETCNHIFAPSPDEIAAARAIVEAFALPENRDAAVIRVEGRMVERLHEEDARRLIALDAAIAQKAGGARH